ncbi:DUF6783 domain-containing protein [Blautia marasmi]
MPTNCGAQLAESNFQTCSKAGIMSSGKYYSIICCIFF